MLCACSGVYAESRVLPPVVEKSTYMNGPTQSASPAPKANAIYDVLGRLEQLQAEVQQLRGVVEEQSQLIVDLQKRQNNIYSDLDQRLQVLTGGEAKVGAGPLAIETNQTVETGFTKPETGSAPGQAVVEDAVATNDGIQPAEVTSNAPVKNQKEMYQEAYETLRNGHNKRAILAFKSLLSDYPDGEYADNSQYWLAEAYKVNQDLSSAKAAFATVISKYPDSPKVADALLKLGYIELEQKNNAKARDYLTQVTVNYPDSTAAHLATKKLMLMDVIQP